MPRLIVFGVDGTIGSIRTNTVIQRFELYNPEAFVRLVISLLNLDNEVAITSNTIDSIDIFAALPESIRNRIIIFGADESQIMYNGYITAGRSVELTITQLFQEKSIPLANNLQWGDALTDYYVQSYKTNPIIRTELQKKALDPDSYQFKTLTKFKACVKYNDLLLRLIGEYKLNENLTNRLFPLRFLRAFVRIAKGKDINLNEVILVDASKENSIAAHRAGFDVINFLTVIDPKRKFKLIPIDFMHFKFVARKAGINSYHVDVGSYEESGSDVESKSQAQGDNEQDTDPLYARIKYKRGSANRGCCGTCTIL